MDYIVFDLETTGLNTLTDDVLEIGAFKLQGYKSDNQKHLKVVDSCRIYFAIDHEVSEEVYKITGLSREILAERSHDRHLSDCKEKLQSLFNSGDLCWVGHNMRSFDQPMLLSNLSRNGIEINYPVKVFDTMQDTCYYPPNLRHYRQYKLSNLYDRVVGARGDSQQALSNVFDKCYGNGIAHEALWDAFMTMYCFSFYYNL
jgi:DNA polymerase III alpha subunit (gram-positive type)